MIRLKDSLRNVCNYCMPEFHKNVFHKKPSSSTFLTILKSRLSFFLYITLLSWMNTNVPTAECEERELFPSKPHCRPSVITTAKRKARFASIPYEAVQRCNIRGRHVTQRYANSSKHLSSNTANAHPLIVPLWHVRSTAIQHEQCASHSIKIGNFGFGYLSVKMVIVRSWRWNELLRWPWAAFSVWSITLKVAPI